jgi:hypothetical protein
MLAAIAAIPAIISSISGVLTRIIPDADKRMEVEGEIQRALIANQSAIYDAMKEVMAADSASESMLTRNARPIVVMWCLVMITWVVVSPMFGLQVATIAAIKAVPSDLWNLVMVGIGGYILAKSVTDAVKAVKK